MTNFQGSQPDSSTEQPSEVAAAPTAAPQPVVFTLSKRDANSYLSYARVPAVPEVKQAIQNALLSSDDWWATDIVVSITREQCDAFIRKATRPTRLWSGRTLKAILREVRANIDAGTYIAPEAPSVTTSGDPDEPSLDEVVGDEPDEYDDDEPQEDAVAQHEQNATDMAEDSPHFVAPEPDTDEHARLVREAAHLADPTAPNYEADAPDDEDHPTS